jgi:hypothetical protein
MLAVQSDGQRFKMIHDRPFEIRRKRRLSFLYKPIDIDCVRFDLRNGHRVGI